MSRPYTEIKQLYTLNDSRVSEEISDSDSSLGESGENLADYQELQRENKRLWKKNEELQRLAGELQLRNQQLGQLGELSQRRNVKHEQKQRDLIKKLSYFQVSNKQMAYEIRRMSQDVMETRENKKISENQISEVKQVIKRSIYEKDKFLSFLKNLLEMLKRCDKPEEYQIEKDKIVQFVQKNITNSEGHAKVSCQFDLKFQLSRVDTLKERIKSLQRELQAAQNSLEKQRGERKKMIGVYNQKINKFRELYDNLKQKVQVQQEQSRRKIKSILLEKNQVIQGLKNRLKESRTRKSSIDIKKSRESKKSFIGDGEYSHLQLNELNEAIENLQMQIIKEFEE